MNIIKKLFGSKLDGASIQARELKRDDFDWQAANNPDSELSQSWSDSYWPPSEWYILPTTAFEKIELVWDFDDPQKSKDLARRMTQEQLLLWAVLNMVGQVCNGGFTQSFYNSYGQLAEESLKGLRLFGFARHAEIFEEAFNVLGERPVPRDRRARCQLVEQLSNSPNLETVVDASDPTAFIQRYSEMAQTTQELWQPMESEFFALLRADTHGKGYDAAFFRPLAEWTYTHRDRIFLVS